MIIASAVKISSMYSQDLPLAALQVSMLPPSMENNFRDPDIKNYLVLKTRFINSFTFVGLKPSRTNTVPTLYDVAL